MRSCIKNKCFEITNEFKNFKFQQYLKVELLKDENYFKQIIFADPWLGSYKKVFDDINIDELLHKYHNGNSLKFENWRQGGSGWSFHSIL